MEVLLENQSKSSKKGWILLVKRCHCRLPSLFRNGRNGRKCYPVSWWSSGVRQHPMNQLNLKAVRPCLVLGSCLATEGGAGLYYRGDDEKRPRQWMEDSLSTSFLHQSSKIDFWLKCVSVLQFCIDSHCFPKRLVYECFPTRARGFWI